MYIICSRFRVAAETESTALTFQSFRRRHLNKRYYFTRPESTGFA
jgi:hypothetical protein